MGLPVLLRLLTAGRFVSPRVCDCGREEEQTLQRCLTHPLIAEDPNAFNYVATLTGEVTRAGSWAANLETSLLEDITCASLVDASCWCLVL